MRVIIEKIHRYYMVDLDANEDITLVGQDGYKQLKKDIDDLNSDLEKPRYYIKKVTIESRRYQ